MRRHLAPLPFKPPERNTSQLDLTIKIESARGWIDLTDGVRYEAAKETRGERAVTWRKQETQGPWVEGSFVSNAVREDVVEVLAVYVYGDTRAEHAELLNNLTDALGQLDYRVLFRVGEVAEYWDCEPADYTVATPQEMLHAQMALVRAQVPRHPRAEIVLASGDEL